MHVALRIVGIDKDFVRAKIVRYQQLYHWQSTGIFAMKQEKRVSDLTLKLRMKQWFYGMWINE